jgi:hypothetical protein
MSNEIVKGIIIINQFVGSKGQPEKLIDRYLTSASTHRHSRCVLANRLFGSLIIFPLVQGGTL